MTRSAQASRIRMLRSQVGVEQRIFWRNLSGTFFTFIIPLALLIILSATIGAHDAIPVVVAISVLSVGFQGVAIQLAMHRDQGVLKRLMASPLEPSVLIASKVLSALIVVLIEVTIIVVVGVGMFDVPRPTNAVAVLVLTIVGTATFVALGFAMASMISHSDAAPAIVNAVYLALMLATAGLARVDEQRQFLELISNALPLGALIEGVRVAWFSGAGESAVWADIIVLLVWGLLGSWWTIARFRWEPVDER